MGKVRNERSQSKPSADTPAGPANSAGESKAVPQAARPTGRPMTLSEKLAAALGRGARLATAAGIPLKAGPGRAAPAAKPAKGKPGGAPRSVFLQFVVNLFRSDSYKPLQGWHARLYTGLGLGLMVAAGAWKVH